MRTPRQRRRQGRRKTRKQRGGVAFANPDQAWGYHLREDIIHDELLKRDNPAMYAIAGTPPNAVAGEDGTMTTLFALARTNDAVNFTAREKATIGFSINKGSETFKNWNPPLLHPGGNNRIGIVQDAGKFITGLIGAQNVITFGHILDPAGTTIAPKTNPMYYQPPPGTSVTIGLQQFGFSSAVISEIVVADFQGGAKAKCAWHLRDKWVDAVSKELLANNIPIKEKTLNNPTPDDAGFFVSREDAIASTDVRTKIGKTLGDTMLVASAMREWGPTPNLMRGIPPPPAAPGQWRWFAPNPEMPARAVTPTAPDVLVLKTIDRLNHLRAVLKDVPSILDSPAPGGARKFTFFPGQVNAQETLRELAVAYNRLPAVVTARYDALIGQFRNAAPGGVLNPNYARFSAGNPSLSGDGLTYGGAVFVMIANRLVQIRDRIAQIVQREADEFTRVTTGRTAPQAAVELQNRTIEYQTANELVNRLAPATADILTNRNVVNQAIVIITAPSGGYTRAPFIGFLPMKIMLHGLFMKIAQNIGAIQRQLIGPAGPGGGGGPTIQQVLEVRIFGNTLFNDNFWGRVLPPIAPAPVVGVIPAQGADMDQVGGVAFPVAVLPPAEETYEREALNEFISSLTVPYNPMEDVRIQDVLPHNTIIAERIEMRAPLIVEFTEFIKKSRVMKVTRMQVINYIGYLNYNREYIPVYSTDVLDQLVDEVKGLVTPLPGDPPILSDAFEMYEYGASPITILYNAFIFHKNAQYAKDPGFTGENTLEDVYFDSISNILLSSARGPNSQRRVDPLQDVPPFIGYNIGESSRRLRQQRVGGSGRRTFRRRLGNEHLKPLHRTVKARIEPA